MEEFLNKYLFDPTISRIIATVVGVILIIIITRIIKNILIRRITDNSVRHKTRKAVSFLGYILIIILISMVYSDKLGGLTVAFGVAGAGIAFALQELIASVAGWFAISFSRFYKTGDRIQLGGIKGDVIDIGVIRTTLMEIGSWVNGDLYNGRVVRVANSFVFKEPVINYSGDFPFLWDEIIIPIKYGSDIGLARQLISKAAHEVLLDYAKSAAESWDEFVKKYPIENAQVEPLITMAADENWMNFTLRYVVEFKKRRITKDILFSRILEDILNTSNKVMIASSSMEVTLFNPKNENQN